MICDLVGSKNAAITKDAACHVQLYLIAYIYFLEFTAVKFITGFCSGHDQMPKFCRSHSPAWSHIGQSSGWLINNISTIPLRASNNFRRSDVLHFHAIHHGGTARGYQFWHRARVFFRTFGHLNQTGTAFTAAIL